MSIDEQIRLGLSRSIADWRRIAMAVGFAAATFKSDELKEIAREIEESLPPEPGEI